MINGRFVATRNGVPIGVMPIATYDPDKDGLIALAQLVAAVCSDAELSDHAGIADAHHAVHLKTLADHALGTVVPHDALASLTEKAHSSLTGVTAAQHHTKTIDASELTTGILALARMANLTSGKVWAGNASNRPAEEDKPAGDMAKATYDPNGDGKIALAQLESAVCSETEAQAIVEAAISLYLSWHLILFRYVQTKDVRAQDTSPYGVFFSPDGLKMYVVGDANNSVYEYTLSTAWDISTASYIQTKDVSPQDTTPYGVFFKPDGLKMYVIGVTHHGVYEYTLSTAWDISTASYVQTKDVTAQDSNATGVFFSPDGLKMYVVGSAYDGVYEYTLSTAWDISTASYIQTKDVTAQDTSPYGVFFKPDGLKMYVVGDANNSVYEYTLTTAWDISTASYIQTKDVSPQDTTPYGVFFKPDGLKMYVIGIGNKSVYEYIV